MRKTYATLLLLGGSTSALAETADITFNRTGTAAGSVTMETESAIISLDDIAVTNATTDDSLGFVNITGFPSDSGLTNTNTLTPNTNVQTANPWKLSFTLTNTGTQSLTLDSLTLDAFTFTGSNNPQNNDRSIKFSLTIGDTPAQEVSLTFGQGGAIGQFNFDLSESITLAAGQDITISIVADKYNQADGCFVGLSGIQLGYTTLPEPTTATLSLLALAGLCTRRRRK